MKKFTDDYIHGSGYSQFPWYAYNSYDEVADALTIVIDCEGEHHERTLTSADTWRAYKALLREEEIYFSTDTHSGDYEDIDLDAGDTDCIIQKAVMGEVIFG